MSVAVESPAWVSPIATPLGDEQAHKYAKKTLKHVEKALGDGATPGKAQRYIYKGVADVTKAIRKGIKGVVLLGADVWPVDLVAHVPGVCTTAGIPFVFVEAGTLRSSKQKNVVLLNEAIEDETYAKLLGKLRSAL